MILGIDVSSHQGAIDWLKVAADPQGIRFAIIRFGVGIVPDTRAGQNWAGAKGAGLVVMPYWAFVETIDGKTQADACIDRFRGVTGSLPHIVWWDYERDDNTANSTSRERFQDALYRTAWRTGKRTWGIYTSESRWEQLITLSGDAPAWTGFTHLWLAHYDTEYPAIPDGWLHYRIHQYSSKGRVNGIAGNVDMNRFPETMPDLRLLAGDFPTLGQRVADLEAKAHTH